MRGTPQADVLQMETEKKYRFDQCGIVMYLDSENWLKGSILSH